MIWSAMHQQQQAKLDKSDTQADRSHADIAPPVRKNSIGDPSAQTSPLIALVRPRAPQSARSRLAVIGGVIALAVAIHWLTGGRWTPVLIGVAGAVSLLALAPPLAWLAKPVGAYAGLWVVFNALRAGADNTDWSDQVLGLVPRLEAWLAAGHLPSAWLQDRFHEANSFGWHDYGLTIVYLSFFIVPYATAGLLLWCNRRLFWQYTVATAALFAVSTVSFYVIPTSPPWLISDVAVQGDFEPVRRITESVLTSVDLPVQVFSEGSRRGARTSEVRVEPNPIAAMPSIHFAATALLIGPARRAGSGLLAAIVVYVFLMGLALVYLGEHYILDLLAGGVLAAIGWFLAGCWLAAANVAP
ncbi:MAG TPA: phosphatase PAP2 family protein [Thermomicrobiales bacterium]|nr:phosphatase PAP2 family protein [Thermomicrobiales bacterium]